jgi:hypothetical protein
LEVISEVVAVVAIVALSFEAGKYVAQAAGARRRV